MAQFFGTDGIRGVANQHPRTSEFVEKVAQAAAFLFKEIMYQVQQFMTEFKKFIRRVGHYEKLSQVLKISLNP